MKHTRGPWRAVVGPKSEQPQPLYKGLVAIVECGQDYKAVVADSVDVVVKEHWEGNTRLIAAAPELLVACREAYRLIKNSPGNWESQTAEMLYEAIRKADPV